MSELAKTYYKSRVGYLEITGDEAGVATVHFTDFENAPQNGTPDCLRDCVQQLEEYFAGERQTFELELKPNGTEFQQSVWGALLKIPFGQTRTYMDIAKGLGKEKAIRAVGAANGANPIPIIIPCHRVIGSNGQLIGFGGGIWRKEFLLHHENATLL